MTWLQTFLNEPGSNEGSSQRLCLFLIVITVLALVSYLTVLTGKLPEVPATLQELVQYLGSLLVAGVAFGKGAAAWKAVKGLTGPTFPTGATEEV